MLVQKQANDVRSVGDACFFQAQESLENVVKTIILTVQDNHIL